jgi:hypothetical protein
MNDDVTVSSPPQGFLLWVLYIKHTLPKAGISKNYCATNSGSPEVELRFCPWFILFKY